MRLLIVYGYEPSGHASAAAALAAAAAELGHEALRVNISADYHPLLGPALAKTYLTIIQKCPGLWGALYDNQAVAEVAQDWRRLYMLLEGGKLRAKLDALEPDLIVCTHAPPLAALALERRRAGLSCALAGVVTDYAVHSYWAAPEVDLYVVPTAEAAGQLRRHGVAEDKIRASGIPIDPCFSRPADCAEARRDEGLAADRPVLLLSGGTRGIGSLEEIAAALRRGLPRAQVLAVCGSNAALGGRLRRRFAADRGVTVLGGVSPERMRRLLGAADVLIGKPGGLTVAESSALGLPMLFFEPIPGQEERNAEYFIARGAAIRAETLDELAGSAEALLGGRGAALGRRAAALGKPEAAFDAVKALLDAAAGSRLTRA